jgi:hypothetical protein
MSDGTTTSVVAVGSWSLETATKVATITDEGFEYESISDSLTVTVGEIDFGIGPVVGAYFEQSGNFHATYYNDSGFNRWFSGWRNVSTEEAVTISSTGVDVQDTNLKEQFVSIVPANIYFNDSISFASGLEANFGKYTLSGGQFGFLYSADDVQANRFQTEYVSNTTGWRTTWRDDTDDQQVQITAEGILITSTTPTVGITGMTAYGVFGPNVPIGVATASWNGTAWVLSNSYGSITGFLSVNSQEVQFNMALSTTMKGCVASAVGKAGFTVSGIVTAPGGVGPVTQISVSTSAVATSSDFVTLIVY